MLEKGPPFALLLHNVMFHSCLLSVLTKGYDKARCMPVDNSWQNNRAHQVDNHDRLLILRLLRPTDRVHQDSQIFFQANDLLN